MQDKEVKRNPMTLVIASILLLAILLVSLFILAGSGAGGGFIAAIFFK